MTPGNILLVEDNPDDRDLTIMALRASKIANEIDIARDGEEALRYFEDRSRPLPALVLLDLKLPRIMGLDVLKRLRADERTKLVPVVVLTSSQREGDRYQSYVEGVNAYVVKPVEFDKFSEAVKALGLFWLVINEPPPDPGARDERTTNRRSIRIVD
jgi:two-component system response regulator